MDFNGPNCKSPVHHVHPMFISYTNPDFPGSSQHPAACTESQDVSRARHASEDDDHRTSAESRRSSRQSARQSVEELTARVVWTYLFISF